MLCDAHLLGSDTMLILKPLLLTIIRWYAPCLVTGICSVQTQCLF